MFSMPIDSSTGHGRGERDPADDIRAPGLFFVRRPVPDGAVERHDIHHAAPDKIRVPFSKKAIGPISAPVPNGAYILCAESARKSMWRGSSSEQHGDRTVRRELRRIHEDLRSGLVRPGGNVMDRGTDAGDVRGAVDRHELHPPLVLFQKLRASSAGRDARPA